MSMGNRTEVDEISATTFSSALVQVAHRASHGPIIAHLDQVKQALSTASAAEAQPDDVIADWDLAMSPVALDAALADADLDPGLADPLKASAAAWVAAKDDLGRRRAARQLNAKFEAGIAALSAALDLDSLRSLRDLTAASPLGEAVEAAVETSLTGLDGVVGSVNTWFDSQMTRLSELYKITARKVLFVAGLALAVGFNVSTIDLVHDLRQDSTARAALVAAANATCPTDPSVELPDLTACAEDLTAALAANADELTLPIAGDYQPPWEALGIGAPDEAPPGAPLLEVIVGWSITGLAISFGAPFWYDVVQRLSSYRRQ